MISFKTFEDENGSVDWNAFREAQINAGEICMTCGNLLIGYIDREKYKQNCYDCDKMINGKEELSHDKYIRCPKCGDFFNPFKNDYHELCDAGEHKIQCTECDYTFEITTHVSFSFDSPERIDNVS